MKAAVEARMHVYGTDRRKVSHILGIAGAAGTLDPCGVTQLCISEQADSMNR